MSESIAFDCPSCGTKYIIVTIDVVDGVQPGKFGCVKCGFLFPAGEGLVSLKYILFNSDADE
jgi:transcription elongation factor Elf1